MSATDKIGKGICNSSWICATDFQTVTFLQNYFSSNDKGHYLLYLPSFSDINTFTMTGTTQLRVAPVSSYFVLKIRVDYGIIGDESKVRGCSHNSEIVKMLLHR